MQDLIKRLMDGEFVVLRQCGICGASNGYRKHPWLAAFVYDSNCDCTPYETEPRVIEWVELDQASENMKERTP